MCGDDAHLCVANPQTNSYENPDSNTTSEPA